MASGQISKAVQSKVWCYLDIYLSIWLSICLSACPPVRLSVTYSLIPFKGMALVMAVPVPGPEVIKLFSCSVQLRSKFILLINVKMPTIVGILTFISRINDWLLWFKPEISIDFAHFRIYEQLKFHAQLSWERKKFYNLGAWSLLTFYFFIFHRFQYVLPVNMAIDVRRNVPVFKPIWSHVTLLLVPVCARRAGRETSATWM